MAVEEINAGAKVADIPMKVAPPDQWTRMAEETALQLKVLTNQKMMDRLATPDQPMAAPESPIKIGGTVNLGTIDFQAQAQEATRKMEEVMKAREAEIKEERARREQAEAENQKMRIDQLQNQITLQMDNMAKMVQSGMQKPKSFMEQYGELKSMIGELGFLSPGAKAAGSDTPGLQLEILRMQGEQARADREFKLLMRNDEKRWNLEVEKLNMERENARARLQAEKDKQEMLAGSIKGLGGAIAAGLLSGGGAAAAGSPAEPAGPVGFIDARMGEAGAIDCPKCHSQIGIGPETLKAVCAKCGAELVVQRT